MNKKNEKRLCWNCDGNVSHHFTQCPFCGVDLSKPSQKEDNTPFQGFASPFQSAPDQQEIPQPPFGQAHATDFTVSNEEWNQVLNEEKSNLSEADEENSATTRREMTALLLLLPGIVFFLFGLTLVFFSQEGTLSLHWNQNIAYFYFLGAVPLLYLGWRAFR